MRGLSYFFGNRDIAEELARLRSDCFHLRDRLLERARVRPLSQTEPDRIEKQQPTTRQDFDDWKQRREAEILEEQALPAAKDDVAFETLEFYAEADPEQWNTLLIEAVRIRSEMAAGTYKEPQER